MKQPSAARDLWRQMRESAGQAYLNRAHQRSFSLNVFQMNAIELMEAAQRVNDPDQGLALMSQNNREAGIQAHREISRHVHNFVTSAYTLVDHTRAFMKKHYEGTALLTAYEEQVKVEFATAPVAQFIKRLRNYMTHRGLPNSSMYLHINNDPTTAEPTQTMKSGVRYDTDELLEWDGWTALDRTYLQQVGEHLPLHQFAQEYLTLVNQHHAWLDAALATYHKADVEDFLQLQAKLEAISPIPSEPIKPVEAVSAEPVERFDFTPHKVAAQDRLAADLFGKVRALELPPQSDGFPTERPLAHITSADIIGPISIWRPDQTGGMVFCFVHHTGKSFGLSAGDFGGIEGLIDAVLSSRWARESLSREFVENTFVDWARAKFQGDEKPFSQKLSEAARDQVKAAEVWAPIANLEVETAFEFGPVRIVPITAAVFEEMRNRGPKPPPEQAEDIAQYFDKLRREIQGFAAVVVLIDGEPHFAQEQALRIAQDAVGLIRFFSPAGPQSFVFSPIALRGAEYLPSSKLITLTDSGFGETSALLPKHIGGWRVPARIIASFNSGTVATAASLVLPDGLTEFSLAVRQSILTYSKGTTLADPMDRLVNCITAVEAIYLRHEMEPRAHKIANRLSYALSGVSAEREETKYIVRQVYWARSQPQWATRGRREEELLFIFTSHAFKAIQLALSNCSNFTTKAEFLTEVDRLGALAK